MRWCELLGTLGDMARVMPHIGTHQPIEEELYKMGLQLIVIHGVFFVLNLWPLV